MRRRRIWRSGGSRSAAAEMAKSTRAMGLVRNPVQPSPIRVRRRLDSARGPRIRPRTAGPAGKPKRSMNNPIRPMISMTKTSKTELLME
ncbi:hypothetical protein ACFFX0_11155 [Citricoccus parietis]|uniref:Uncharacterized protein n=1 Tax=Citricoccus parietis TaxID=592307 RepID=A0ABV5FYH4_9MICC